MPIEFWKAKTGWFWTARSPNGRLISDSAEIYSSRLKAENGAHATAVEFEKWRKENKPKPPKSAISGHQKPAAKRSTSSSNPTRKTAKRGG